MATQRELAIDVIQFALELQPAMAKLKAALDKVPVGNLPASAQAEISRIKVDIDGFVKRRLYNPNPKHELASGFHAYPSTGNEIASSYPSVANRIAGMLGVEFKRLSRMD